MDHPAETDRLLDALARDLDRSFAPFVRAHERLVFGVCYRALRNPHDAEDAAQDTFVRAYRAIAGYPPERIRALRPRAWLAQIALNAARNQRRDQPSPTVPLEVAPDGSDEPRHAPAAILEEREADRHWARLLDALPAPHRRAVELRHVHGLSYAEIATALDRPVGTVKVHVHRGVRLLREAHDAALQQQPARGAAPIAATGTPRPTLRLVSEVSR